MAPSSTCHRSIGPSQPFNVLPSNIWVHPAWSLKLTGSASTYRPPPAPRPVCPEAPTPGDSVAVVAGLPCPRPPAVWPAAGLEAAGTCGAAVAAGDVVVAAAAPASPPRPPRAPRPDPAGGGIGGSFGFFAITEPDGTSVCRAVSMISARVPS